MTQGLSNSQREGTTSRGPCLRIANCSGFYGDRFQAAKEMVEGGPIDFLTGDYLAELTMLILWKARQKDPSLGYATTFLRQMEEVLGTCMDRQIKVVTNAGGLNPAGLAEKLHELANRLGLSTKVSYITGDDVLPRLEELREKGYSLANMDTGAPLQPDRTPPITANVYLGAFGIVEALNSGADVVVCPRVTDASLVVGPAAWYHGWKRTDYDQLAGAVVAGHILECGAQATGGNYSFFQEVPGLEHPGFPLAEVYPDGSSVITKHEGTGGQVSIGTITAQLLYEIGSPYYLNPDVIARFDSIRLEEVTAGGGTPSTGGNTAGGGTVPTGVEGDTVSGGDNPASTRSNRVKISGVKGEPPPDTAKVCINLLGGYRNSITFVLCGLDIEEKAALAERSLWRIVGGRERFEDVDVRLIRSDHPDAPTNEEATALLRITVKDRDPIKVGRSFSNAAIEMALANYPGFYLTTPPTPESAYGVYWPTLIPAELVNQIVITHDGREIPVPVLQSTTTAGSTSSSNSHPSLSPPPLLGDQEAAEDQGTKLMDWRESDPAQQRRTVGIKTTKAPLGLLAGARSGDKGGNANLGLWVKTDKAYEWLVSELSIARLKELLTEAEDLVVHRYELPNLRALNFVIEGLLGEGVASSTRPDPQAKSLGEYIRSRVVSIPNELLENDDLGQTGAE